MTTVTPRELEHVKEEDEEQLNLAGDSINNPYQHIYYTYSHTFYFPHTRRITIIRISFNMMLVQKFTQFSTPPHHHRHRLVPIVVQPTRTRVYFIGLANNHLSDTSFPLSR